MPKGKKVKSGEVDIFSVLAEGDELDVGDEQERAPAGGDAGVEARIQALQENLTRLEKTNRALMTQSGNFSPTTQPTMAKDLEEPDFSGLPDPITEPDAYQKEFSKRISANLQAKFERDQAQRDAQAAAQRDQGARVDGLWGDFEEKYPDLAEHKDLVEVAAIAVANKARAKGVDVQKYMFTASDQYIEDVAQEMKKRFGKALEVIGKGDEETEAGEESGGTMADALASARTRGISGGLPTSGKPKAGGDDAPSARDDLITDLHKVQRAMGII